MFEIPLAAIVILSICFIFVGWTICQAIKAPDEVPPPMIPILVLSTAICLYMIVAGIYGLATGFYVIW